MRYVINSAVITSPGEYKYSILDIEDAKKWLLLRDFESTIGYQETATALQRLTGVKVEVNRKQISMEVGDEALVFRLTCRLQDPELKGKLNDIDFIVRNSEIGMLIRVL